MSDLKTSEILRAAADVIETRGLHKGYFYWGGRASDPGAVCMFGAINFAESGEADIGASDELNWSATAAMGYGSLQSVVDWNDAPERTADEVRDALLEAAMRAEAAGE